jgi:Hydroxymethylglutaryl-coenzyme A synthase N terminal
LNPKESLSLDRENFKTQMNHQQQIDSNNTTTTSNSNSSNLNNDINTSTEHYPGILGIEVYIPKLYISQSLFEDHMGVATGKYTIGLGQINLSIPCGDIEDINSICLTVVSNLLEKYVLLC